MGGQRPHVEIAAVIPDGQGKIVIGKRKGKTGTGMMTLNINPHALLQPVDDGALDDVNGGSDDMRPIRTL